MILILKKRSSVEFEFSNTSEGFENAKAWVDLICLRFANVILTNLTGFDGVQ